jgi:hypothetical protein
MNTDIPNALSLFTNQLSQLSKAAHEEWLKTNASSLSTFIESHLLLIVNNQEVLRTPLSDLADRILDEMPDDPKALELAVRIRDLAGEIILPPEIIANILRMHPHDSALSMVQYYARTARVSKNTFRELSKEAKVDYINDQKVPIGKNLGLETKEEALAFIKQCGPRLKSLTLNGAKESELFSQLTSQELLEILNACPNLTVLELKYLDNIDESVWNCVKQLVNLNSLTIECSNLKIPDLTHLVKLERLSINGIIDSLPKAFPPHLQTLKICQWQQNSSLQLPEVLPNQLKVLIAAGLNTSRLPPFPDSLIKISLRETQADHLPNRWPANLKILKFVRCGLTNPPNNLPRTLAIFKVAWCPSLSGLPQIPPQLKVLEVQECPHVLNVGELPDTLEELVFLNDRELITVPKLSPKIRSLELSQSHTSWDQILSKEHIHLTHLGISDFRLQTAPDVFPDSLTSLRLNMVNLIHLAPLPRNLRKFDLTASNDYTELDQPLPIYLETLEVNAGLKSLPELPESMKELDVGNCESLRLFEIRDMPKLKKIVVPQVLNRIAIINCPKLKIKRPELFNGDGLRTLIVRNNDLVRSLPSFPLIHNDVFQLDFSGCRNLVILGNLRNTLCTSIKLNGCSRLRTLSDMPKYLQAIEIDRCPKLKVADFTNCRYLKVIADEFNDGLSMLVLSYCEELESAPSKLPRSLRLLDVRGVLNYKSIWSDAYLNQLKNSQNLIVVGQTSEKGTPLKRWEAIGDSGTMEQITDLNLKGVTELVLKNCVYEFDDDLSSVAKLSVENSDISDLILNGCSHLVSAHLKGCDQLVNIDLANCPNLRAITGEFSNKLEYLNLTNCFKLIAAPSELPKRLKLLDVRGVANYHHIWPNQYLRYLQQQNPELIILGLTEIQEYTED